LLVIYGNANTNTVYNRLLDNCPISVERNKINAGNEALEVDDRALILFGQ
jgi:hypothetical protein